MVSSFLQTTQLSSELCWKFNSKNLDIIRRQVPVQTSESTAPSAAEEPVAAEEVVEKPAEAEQVAEKPAEEEQEEAGAKAPEEAPSAAEAEAAVAVQSEVSFVFSNSNEYHMLFMFPFSQQRALKDSLKWNKKARTNPVPGGRSCGA